MTVVAGLRQAGLFSRLAHRLCLGVGNLRVLGVELRKSLPHERLRLAARGAVADGDRLGMVISPIGR